MTIHTSFAVSVQPELISTIYRCIIDEGDLVAALLAIKHTFDAETVALSRQGRGEEAELAKVTSAPIGHDALCQTQRFEGPLSGQGRRLVLTLTRAARPLRQAQDLGPEIEMLLGHIDRAVTLSGQMTSFRVERAIGSKLLDRLAIGTVFLNAERQVVAMTGMAERMLASGAGLRLRAGSLTATCGTKDRLLQAEIRAALANPAGKASSVLRVQHPDSDCTLGVVVEPVAEGDAAGDIACAIIIRDGDGLCEPELAMLRDLFDLTPAEAMLTRALSLGQTLDEAAEDLNIRRNTARAHLRAIFSKCGIKRQTELMRLVLTSVAMQGRADLPKAA